MLCPRRPPLVKRVARLGRHEGGRPLKCNSTDARRRRMHIGRNRSGHYPGNSQTLRARTILTTPRPPRAEPKIKTPSAAQIADGTPPKCNRQPRRTPERRNDATAMQWGGGGGAGDSGCRRWRQVHIMAPLGRARRSNSIQIPTHCIQPLSAQAWRTEAKTACARRLASANKEFSRQLIPQPCTFGAPRQGTHEETTPTDPKNMVGIVSPCLCRNAARL